jgi:hypothetical protein
MGKTVEVNLTLSNLLDDKFRVAGETHIQSISDSPSDLTASFSEDSLKALLAMDNCDGIRMYPAVNNNELIMIAWGTNGKDDLIGPDYFCLASNDQGTVSINGAVTVEGVEQVPTALASALVSGNGSGTKIVDDLNKVRYQTGLKVLFDGSFFTDQDFDEIMFEVIDVKLSDTDELKRTIIGTAKYKNDEVFSRMSFLPCPPNCGGGAYGNEQTLVKN